MKRLIALLVVAAAVAAAIAVPALAATKTVRVGPQISFGPKSVSIKSGDTVRFRWAGSLPHDVVITKGPGIRGTKKISGSATPGPGRRKSTPKAPNPISAQ